MVVEAPSRSDAEAHIAKIRQDKGLLDGSSSGPNVSDLENALTTLSEQLYQSSTHFLLELVQNADDNTYDFNVQPSVHFSYSNGCLRVDCNEVGFSPRNVEALCRVGQSTKKGADKAKGYVGEKGIGFKSVFKAADVVWISSRNYSFKFDKSQQLGMIAPIWAPFPVPVKPGFTSIYLQLSESYNRRGLLDELRLLDSRILIFLRRLRNINVTISEPFRPNWTSSFSRTEIGKDLIRLVDNKTSCDYIIKRHQAANMPQEPKRQGTSSSEIILGFPVTQNGMPKRESQKAYAFLPIRDYGFEFLIQADFLLIASREDIDDSSRWNHALRSELSTAFVNAMKGFNEGPLRHAWMEYLPLRDPLNSFLKPFHLDLKKKLASESILYSQAGDLMAPGALTYVPEEFKINGIPMTASALSTRRYLSDNYSQADLKYFEILEVTKMNEYTFILELQSLLRMMKEEFKAKPNDWHSQLATILIRMQKTYLTDISKLEIIPLSNGDWVAASGRAHQILFPSSTAGIELPSGLELLVVQTFAAADLERRKLYKILGVGDLDKEPVIRHIQYLHTNRYTANSSAGSLGEMISQIKFLYSAEFKNNSFQRFWFTAESGQKFEGSQLYQDSSKPHSATKFFGTNRSKFPFIHNTYKITAGKDSDSWSTWLEEKMDVATMPRLVQPTRDKGWEMSDHFEFIIKNFTSSEVLLLLRDNWKRYSAFINPDKMDMDTKQKLTAKYDASKFTASAHRLEMKLRSMLVTCTNGKKQPLNTTFLPSKEILVAAQDDMPFVDIPDANNEGWKVLEILGVTIKVDVSFYLRCLERLEGERPESSDDIARIQRLLDTTEFRCDEGNKDTIVNFFGKKELVYIPAKGAGSPSKWIALQQCRWKGPQHLLGHGKWGKNAEVTPTFRTFECLKDIYPRNKRLFCRFLGVEDVSVTDLAKEARQFKTGDSLAHITSMFHAIEKLLEEEPEPKPSKASIRSLGLTATIFPVSKNWDLDTDRVSGLMHALKDPPEWFIADTSPFRTIFAGIVPLLDIEVDDLAAMDQILQEFDLKDRLLTKQAKSVPRTQGVVEFNQELTDSLRSKVDFIIRLLPTTKQYRSRRRDIVKQLQNLQVYTADEVIQEYHVSYKGKLIKGPPGNGHVALTITKDDILKIYLAKAAFETGLELVDEMFSFCGMMHDNPQHSEMCLHVALSQTNPARIMKVFSDKGIPSLESLKFADQDNANESESEDEAEPSKVREDPAGFPPVYSAGFGSKTSVGQNYNPDGQKKRSRPFHKFAIGAVTILGLPFGLAFGLGKLAKDALNTGQDNERLFDGENNKPNSTKKAKIKVPASDPSVPKQKNRSERTPSMQKFGKSVSRGWLILQHKACPSVFDKEIAFKGEFAIHKELASSLGQSYNPRQHWTSPLRSRANLPIFTPTPSSPQPTFKFSDTSGAFTQILTSSYPQAASWITNPPTYHLDVKATRGGLREEFEVRKEEFERARELSVMVLQMRGDVGSVPRDVYVLVRVWDVGERDGDGEGALEGGKEKVMFLVDPWEHYHAERLGLRSKGGFIGSLMVDEDGEVV